MTTIEYRRASNDILSQELVSAYQHPGFMGLVGFGLCETDILIEEHQAPDGIVTTLAVPSRRRIYFAPPIGSDGILQSVRVVNALADRYRDTDWKIIAKDHAATDLRRIRDDTAVFVGGYQAFEGRVTQSLRVFDPALQGSEYAKARQRLHKAEREGLQFDRFEMPDEVYPFLSNHVLSDVLQSQPPPNDPGDDKYNSEVLIEGLRQADQIELSRLIEKWAIRKRERNYPDKLDRDIWQQDIFKLRELIPMLALAWKGVLPGVEAYAVRDRDNELVGVGLIFTSTDYAYLETKATHPDTQAAIFMDYHLRDALKRRQVGEVGLGQVVGHEGQHWGGLLRYKELLGRFNPDTPTFAVRFVVDSQYQVDPDPKIFS